MAVNDSILNKTKNYFRAVGTVNELDLKREPCDVKIWEDGKAIGEVKGERIRGKISLKTDKGIHTFDVFNQIRGDAEEIYNSLKSKGQEKEAKDMKRKIDHFHMFEEAMKWTTVIGNNAGDEPTLVSIAGSVAINDYVNQQGELSSTLRWNVSSANTRVSADDPKGTTLKATLYIDSIRPEMKNEEETGRLLLTAYGANKNGTCFPINAIVPETIKDTDGGELRLAETFEDYYEVGMTVPFEFELSAYHVGGKKNGAKKFGRNGSVAVNDGYDKIELMLVGGDDEIEEPDELTTEDENGNEVEVKTEWIKPVAMQRAKKARAQMLDELAKNPPKKSESKPKSSLKEAKDKAKADKKFGTTKSNFPPDDEPPFDTDEDDINW